MSERVVIILYIGGLAIISHSQLGVFDGLWTLGGLVALISDQDRGFLILLCFILGVCIVFGLPFVSKSQLLTTLSTDGYQEMSAPGATLPESDWVDVTQFEALSAQWEIIGFERGQEIVTNADQSDRLSSAQRWFKHTESGAIACVMQFKTSGHVLPVSSSITSYWGDEASLVALFQARQDKVVAPIALPAQSVAVSNSLPDILPVSAYVSANRKLHWTDNMLRHPQEMTRQLVEVAPEHLWRSHRARCEAVSLALGPPLCGDNTTLNAYYERLLRRGVRRQIHRTNAIPLIYGAWLQGTRRSEYLGAFKGQIPPATGE